MRGDGEGWGGVGGVKREVLRVGLKDGFCGISHISVMRYNPLWQFFIAFSSRPYTQIKLRTESISGYNHLLMDSTFSQVQIKLGETRFSISYAMFYPVWRMNNLSLERFFSTFFVVLLKQISISLYSIFVKLFILYFTYNNIR